MTWMCGFSIQYWVWVGNRNGPRNDHRFLKFNIYYKFSTISVSPRINMVRSCGSVITPLDHTKNAGSWYNTHRPQEFRVFSHGGEPARGSLAKLGLSYLSRKRDSSRWWNLSGTASSIHRCPRNSLGSCTVALVNNICSRTTRTLSYILDCRLNTRNSYDVPR